MKKLSAALFLAVTILFSTISSADPYRNSDYDNGFVLADVLVIRPLGFAATIAGSAAFVLISPLTAFANIAPPHDAFEKTANILVKAPANYTFSRPLGVQTLMDFPEPESVAAYNQ